MRNIDLIVIHCSDSDHPHHDNIDIIRQWHTQERGFNDVGYHFVITKNGGIQFGRPIDKMGAHALRYNRNSIGICLTGKHTFSEHQYDTLRKLVSSLKIILPGKQDVKGHCELSSKTCPNFDYKKVLNL